jgi:hypothetical protein
MILNETHAMVHLPIPFKGEQYEASNFAALIESPDVVQQLKEEFEAMWESACYRRAAKFITANVSDEHLCLLHPIVYSHRGGIEIGDLYGEYVHRIDIPLSVPDVNTRLASLVTAKQVRMITRKGTAVYYPSRYTRGCRVLDLYRRMNLV